jgi:hypothetical protein
LWGGFPSEFNSSKKLKEGLQKKGFANMNLDYQAMMRYSQYPSKIFKQRKWVTRFGNYSFIFIFFSFPYMLY